MYGYACWETVELLPAPVVLANRITSLLTTCPVSYTHLDVYKRQQFLL